MDPSFVGESAKNGKNRGDELWPSANAEGAARNAVYTSVTGTADDGPPKNASTTDNIIDAFFDPQNIRILWMAISKSESFRARDDKGQFFHSILSRLKSEQDVSASFATEGARTLDEINLYAISEMMRALKSSSAGRRPRATAAVPHPLPSTSSSLVTTENVSRRQVHWERNLDIAVDGNVEVAFPVYLSPRNIFGCD